MSRDQHLGLLKHWSEQNLEATMSAQNYTRNERKTKDDSLNWAISLTITALILLFVLGATYAITVAKTSLQPTAGSGG
jgi:hypothetical protein